MRAFLTKYQIILFFALVFLISWYPWYLGGHGVRTWGPSLAGLIVVLLAEGLPGIKKMWQRLIHWRVGWKWWLISLFTPAVMVLAAIGIHVLRGETIAPPDVSLLQLQMVVAVVVALGVVIATKGKLGFSGTQDVLPFRPNACKAPG